MGFQDTEAGSEANDDGMTWVETMEAQDDQSSKESIEQWVEALDITNNKVENEETMEDPSTPPQRHKDCEHYSEEVSPTDTEFSLDSVFDSPVSPLGLSGSQTDRERYAATEASSIDDDEEAYARKEVLTSTEVGSSSTAKREGEFAEASSQDAVILIGDEFSKTTPGEVSTPSVALAVVSAPPFDPHATHLLWLTSCLQCVLADLPCSRTIPACSRCVRKGNGEMCLLQRRRIHLEIVNDNYCCDPILLRRKDDNSDIFEKKEELQGELLEVWREKYERNFRAPSNTEYKWTATHPGVGKGRVVSYRMQIAHWQPNAVRGTS